MQLTADFAWQHEGNAAADAEKYSAALKFWDQAIRLTPLRAALHEQKAQASFLAFFAQNIVQDAHV